MQHALNNNKIIAAQYASKFKGDFQCPDCLENVSLKTPKIPEYAPGHRKAHFSHLRDTSCPAEHRLPSVESEKHVAFKNELYLKLVDECGVDNVEMEKRLDGCRPDIWLNVPDYDGGIAFEIQLSSIDKDYMSARTLAHCNNNLYTCWLFPEGYAYEGNLVRFHVEVAAKWNYNVAFILQNDLRIKPIKLTPLKNDRGEIRPHRFSILEGRSFDITNLDKYCYLRNVDEDLRYRVFKKKLVTLKRDFIYP